MSKFLIAMFICVIGFMICQAIVNWDQNRRIKELEEAVSKLLYFSGVQK